MTRPWWDVVEPSWQQWHKKELTADAADGCPCSLKISGPESEHAIIHYENYYRHGEGHHGFQRSKKCDRVVVHKRRRGTGNWYIDLVELKKSDRDISKAKSQLEESDERIKEKLRAARPDAVKTRWFCATPNGAVRSWEDRKEKLEVIKCGATISSPHP